MEEKKINNSSGPFLMFVAKAVVITILLSFFLDSLIPDFSEPKAELEIKLANVMKEERTKLYLLSIVQNPAVLYKTSELAERAGKFDNALRDMELAIGLLEMHGADKSVIKRYSDRVERLKVAVSKRP
jgi:hypothetical protein